MKKAYLEVVVTDTLVLQGSSHLHLGPPSLWLFGWKSCSSWCFWVVSLVWVEMKPKRISKCVKSCTVVSTVQRRWQRTGRLQLFIVSTRIAGNSVRKVGTSLLL